MRATALAAIIVALSAGSAHADWSDPHDWYRRLAAVTRSLIGEPPADPDIIKPPKGENAEDKRKRQMQNHEIMVKKAVRHEQHERQTSQPRSAGAPERPQRPRRQASDRVDVL